MNERQKTYLIHIGLFIITLITTTLAGVEWTKSKFVLWVDEPFRADWSDFVEGFRFSIPFLLILTFHEFGHYFTAKFHRIKTTLPYYIPLWLGFAFIQSFGTMGAFIRIKENIRSLKHYFDVGVSGPVAGFVVALGVIWYGYSHLPNPESIYEIHPEYEQFGLDYADTVYTYSFMRHRDSLSYMDYMADKAGTSVEALSVEDIPPFKPRESYESMYFGKPLLYMLVEKYLVTDADKVPGDQEIMHNPYLLAGLLALFFTALNLLPIGQLDGGHILFGLLGPRNHLWVSKILFSGFLFYAGLGLVSINSLEDVGLDSSLNYLLILVAYSYFLYVCAYSMFESKTDRWTFAAVMLTAQFMVNFLFGWEGYLGWLLFAFLLGRVLGIRHPPVLDRTPLSTGRKVLGWIAFGIFILSFSPEPFVIELVGQ